MFKIVGYAATAVLLISGQARAQTGDQWKILGWNDLGMHCMDDSYDVFSILPPYNTIHAQLIDPSGNRLTSPSGITVTYEAITDPTGSINTTSAGKTNFWQYVAQLFGASPPVDQGLAGSSMPGAGNLPQPMQWEGGFQWFTAEGIPLTPYDDSGNKNYYPLMRLVARDSGGAVIATTDIVLPISDEMTCTACHASGSPPASEPAAGWVNDPDPVRDYRLNVLLKHDDLQLGTPTYQQALADAGYSAAGLYDTVVTDGTPILCYRCHASNALAGTGMDGIPALTAAMHGLHATVTDPATGMTLDASENRTACYRCHPGSDTRCLRGAMGHATAADASLSIQCQSCHGTMSTVGDPTRAGWLDEPTCQNCHTGTATDNSGQIRFLTAFDSPGHYRIPASAVFATNPDTPAPGISLFRFSTGHGGLQCESCHGSTHAIFPSSHANDEIRNRELQGHAGTVAECSACHGGQPQTTTGGPHGMHPVGQTWVERHHDVAEEGGAAACRTCHGNDYRGTVLSRALGDRTVSAFGTKNLWKGYQIGCYTCHNGPSNDHANPNHPPSATDLTGSVASGGTLTLTLQASDADGDALQLRVVSQPAHGRAGVGGTTATYIPDPGFTGADSFTYAASDGMADSNLATVTVSVGPGSCTLSCSATVPDNGLVGDPVRFAAVATPNGCSGTPEYSWSFGDGSTSNVQNPQHTYDVSGTFTWTVTATLNGASCSKTGTIVIDNGGTCSVECSADVPSGAQPGETVQFAALATPNGCSGTPEYSWSFGDGSTSNVQNPQHAYDVSGAYTWTVTATLNGASCSKTGTIVIESGGTCSLECTADAPDSARVGQRVRFSSEVTPSEGCSGTPTLLWDFGDGSSSNRSDPRHTYRHTGSFSWTFTASLEGSTCAKDGTIKVLRSGGDEHGGRHARVRAVAGSGSGSD